MELWLLDPRPFEWAGYWCCLTFVTNTHFTFSFFGLYHAEVLQYLKDFYCFHMAVNNCEWSWRNPGSLPTIGCAVRYRLTFPSPLKRGKCPVLTSLFSHFQIQHAWSRKLKLKNRFLNPRGLVWVQILLKKSCICVCISHLWKRCWWIWLFLINSWGRAGIDIINSIC